MMNSKTEQANASLNIVPYYVIKNPSDPSLMGSLISCIALDPWSLSRIQHNSHILIAMNTTDMTRAVNAIVLDVLFDTHYVNNRIKSRGDRSTHSLNAFILFWLSL